MFIPDVKLKIRVGDIVILKNDINVTGGIFTRCHKFKVINIKEGNKIDYSYLDVIDDDENYLKNIRIENFCKNIDYKEAKKIQEKINYKKEVIKCIVENCKNKTIEIDGRDYYDGCKLKKNKYYPVCEPMFSCIEYSEKANKKYPGILRYLKIKKIKDEREN